MHQKIIYYSFQLQALFTKTIILKNCFIPFNVYKKIQELNFRQETSINHELEISVPQ